ncbi:histidine kinase [Microbacterium sp. NC79]|uniref:histidine kinase n=1 Tax=Microbacterium sp. NC79 TaxID=2851009 RepID=UPI001C2C78C4|nr:histidine kinase [Microbacterium sp. NC79]MBV0894368.1 histidine kinase [Microbacterium sp. NC79]
MKSRIAARIAATIMALEALVMMGLAILQVVELVKGNTASLTSAIALIVLTLIIGAGMAAFAWGLRTDQTWARSGGIVTQLMALAVALGAVTGQYAHPAIAAMIAAPAIVALIAIFKASQQTAAADRARHAAEQSAEVAEAPADGTEAPDAR